MEDFNTFSQNMGIIGVLVLGKKFLWVSANGKCMTKLYLLLVFDGLVIYGVFLHNG